jgi:hypothetical protein
MALLPHDNTSGGCRRLGSELGIRQLADVKLRRILALVLVIAGLMPVLSRR